METLPITAVDGKDGIASFTFCENVGDSKVAFSFATKSSGVVGLVATWDSATEIEKVTSQLTASLLGTRPELNRRAGEVVTLKPKMLASLTPAFVATVVFRASSSLAEGGAEAATENAIKTVDASRVVGRKEGLTLGALLTIDLSFKEPPLPPPPLPNNPAPDTPPALWLFPPVLTTKNTTLAQRIKHRRQHRPHNMRHLLNCLQLPALAGSNSSSASLLECLLLGFLRN